jgi:GNAT superfamily N-acetyltransferase
VPDARRATAADADELVRLGAQMFASMGLDVDANDWRARGADVVRMLDGSDAMGAFAVDDPDRPGRLCAAGVATVGQRLPSPMNPSGRQAYIQWVCTDPGHRRRGLGEVVMRALLDWCASVGVTQVELHATADGEGLYRHLGFADGPNPHLRLRR